MNVSDCSALLAETRSKTRISTAEHVLEMLESNHHLGKRAGDTDKIGTAAKKRYQAVKKEKENENDAIVDVVPQIIEQCDRPPPRIDDTLRKAIRSHTVATTSYCSSHGPLLVAGRLEKVELENFMCHGNLKLQFDSTNCNAFYLGGPNGSGKSALFAAINLGLGGAGRMNERGNKVKCYIKEGKQRARTRITLSNEGQGADETYGRSVVVERTINSTCSTYKIFSVTGVGRDLKETCVSTKKKELDRLMSQFGIHLSNPIFWMSQDKCRSFLQQLKPDKLYDIFASATELDKTSEVYDDCEEMTKQCLLMIQNITKTVSMKREQANEMRRKRESQKCLNDHKKQLEELNWQLAWSSVNERIADVKDNSTSKQALEERLQTLLANMDMNQDNTNERKEELVSMTGKLKKINEKHMEIQQLYHQMLGQKGSLESNLSELDKTRQVLVEKRKGTERKLMLVKKKIAEIENSSLENEHQRDVYLSQKLEKRVEESERLKKKAESEYEEAAAVTIEITRQQSKILEHKSGIEARIKAIERDIQMSQATSKNRLARFGEAVPDILDLLNKNRNIFQNDVVGPLGMYVSVKDVKWALAVEMCLGQRLQTFAFGSKRDLDTFNSLMRRHNVNSQGIRNVIIDFTCELYKTNDPSADWDTVKRAINVSDNRVMNILVDMNHIESVLLFPDDGLARRLMDGQCPEGCGMGYTASGAQVHGRSPSGRGMYRFYPSKTTRVRMLTDNQMDNPSNMAEHRASLIKSLEEVKLSARQIDGDVKRAYAQENDLKHQKMKAERECHQLKSEAQAARKKVQANEDFDADDQMSSLAESRRIHQDDIDKCNIELERVEKERDELRCRLSDLKQKMRRVEEEENDIKMGMTHERETMDGLKQKLSDLCSEKADLEDKRKKFEGELRAYGELSKRLAQDVSEVLERVREETHGMVVPDDMVGGMIAHPDYGIIPNLTKLCIRSDIEIKIKQKKLDIKNAETLCGEHVSREMYNEARNEVNEIITTINHLKNNVGILQKALAQRKEKFPTVRHRIAMRLVNAFMKLMLYRGYRGQLDIDFDKRLIKIIAETHNKESKDGEDYETESPKKRAKDNAVSQDLKGLSGGERSFTTACFVMALWEVMEAPFRCMDEFDVFMDMSNRTIVMDLLVERATKHFPHCQFLFFTPQGTKELKNRPRVQKLELPKVRD